MPRKVFTFAADDPGKPLANLGAVYVVVVNPALIPRVVRRVDVDALHLAGVVRQQGFRPADYPPAPAGCPRRRRPPKARGRTATGDRAPCGGGFTTADFPIQSNVGIAGFPRGSTLKTPVYPAPGGLNRRADEIAPPENDQLAQEVILTCGRFQVVGKIANSALFLAGWQPAPRPDNGLPGNRN